MNARMIWILALFCLPFVAFGVFAEDSAGDDLDAIVGELAASLGIEETQDAPADESIHIRDIRIRINGTTKEDWVRSRLFIAKNQRFTEAQWRRVSTSQADYFLETGLFYNANVYLLPLAEPGDFVCVVELTDGFMYAFNFWPWDVSLAFKHLLNGNEWLEFTLGPTTQRVYWSHPVVNGTPFSYKLAVGHLFREYEDGWLEDSFVTEGSLYASIGPWIDTGLESDFRYYSLPESSPLAPSINADDVAIRLSQLGLGNSGSLSRIGVFAELWPNYRFMQPLGFNLQLAGGAAFPSGDEPSWYARSRLRLYVRPVRNLVGELTLSGLTNGPGVPAPAWPDSTTFRSSSLLEPRPTFVRAVFQMTALSVVSAPMGFTTMTLNPYTFIETAGTFDMPDKVSVDGMQLSAGGALAVGFSYPVDLYFSFGAQCGIYPKQGISFLFSVETDLY